jgi:hypothetical protein
MTTIFMRDAPPVYPSAFRKSIRIADRNASGTQPAKFVVLLIKDKGAPALVPAQ